jgi:hypothetical protein
MTKPWSLPPIPSILVAASVVCTSSPFNYIETGYILSICITKSNIYRNKLNEIKWYEDQRASRFIDARPGIAGCPRYRDRRILSGTSRYFRYRILDQLSFVLSLEGNEKLQKHYKMQLKFGGKLIVPQASFNLSLLYHIDGSLASCDWRT